MRYFYLSIFSSPERFSIEQIFQEDAGYPLFESKLGKLGPDHSNNFIKCLEATLWLSDWSKKYTSDF